MGPSTPPGADFHVRFLAYDASRGVFRLSCACPSSNEASAAESASIWREIGDFQSLDRAVHRDHKTTAASAAAAVSRLSLRRLKKLTASSWVRDDVAQGWRRELHKNVAYCEQWLATALAKATPSDSQRFVDDDAYAAHHRARQATQQAKNLQQYFTGASVVQHVVERLPGLLRRLQLEPLDSERVAWLEPSCGDARFVHALIAAGAKRVVGYELDPIVYATAKASVDAMTCGRGAVVTLEQGDFLVTNRPSAWETGTETAMTPVTTTVLAVGNPPFGSDTAAIDRGDEDRDLVDKFLLHVALVWRAQLVAFIVPARCARPEYVARLLLKLNGGEERRVNEGDRAAAGEVWRWTMEVCEPLVDCEFEFQTTKRVHQPSALVVFASKPVHATQRGNV